jgi:hypothetical protein
MASAIVTAASATFGGGRLGAERGRALERLRLALRRRALEDAQVLVGQ